MASNTETFVIRLKDQGVEKGLDNVGNKTDKAHKKVNALSGAFRVFGGILAGVSIAALGMEVIDTLAKFERFEAVLTNTFGSNSQAKKALAEITDFAAKTPFAVDELTESYVKLANQGFTPTMLELTKLGDLAASTGKPFDMLTEAILDAKTNEFERLKEFGIKSKKEGENVTFTFKEQETTVKATSGAIQAYLLGLGKITGVTGAMAAISETTGGKISNMKDSLTQMYLVIGQSAKPAIDGLIGVLGKAIEAVVKFVKFLGSGTSGAEAFKVVVVILGSALITFGALMAAVTTYTKIATAAQYLYNAALTANPIGLVIVAIGALIGFIIYLATSFEGFGKQWKHVVEGSKLVFMAYVSAVKGMWNGLIDGFMIGLNTIKKGWYEFQNAVGLGDSAENLSIIQRIDADTERRKKEIANSIDETLQLSKEAIVEFALAGLSVTKIKTAEQQAQEDKENAVNGGSLAGLGGIGGKSNKVSAGISEVKASAPKIFNINIESLIKENNINTTTLTEGSVKIKDLLTRALLTAVNDSQIIAE
tara:strand:- start:3452 stop:5062 length:1611 start_codon:yes stop_codon:yes gene_type:complete